MAKYTLLKNIDGNAVRFYLDTAKAVKGELENLEGRGWTKEPSSLKDIPCDEIRWEGKVPVKVKLSNELRSTKVRRKRASTYEPVGDSIDTILKQFKAFKDAGMQLLPETDDLLANWQKVKDDNPLN